MKRRTVAALLLILLAGTGCSGHDSEPGSAPPRPGTSSAAAELAYGRAPVIDGDITYRPDVVVVGGGADMVRSVSGDSFTWYIDSRAPHLGDLEPGKVMFLTSRAVGRVLAIEDQGDVVAVTLGPVDLTDVISDGDVHVEAPIDLSAASFQTYPDMPGTVEPSAPTASVNPAVWTPGKAAPAVFSARQPGDPLPPPFTGNSVKVTAGDYSADLGRAADELSLKLGYKKRGVTVGLKFSAKFKAPTITANLSFVGGSLARNELRIDGLKELSVNLLSGSEVGLSGNFKSRIEVPAEMTFPVPAGPVPLVASIRFKFIVETAFSARNATLIATGRLKVDGPIGFAGGHLLLPTVQQTESPVDNLTGPSVGVNGVVVALQLKVVIGLGVPAAMAGPFGAVTVAYGLTNGSSIGIVQCRQASLDVVVAGGVGFTLDPGKLQFLTLLMQKVPWAPKLDSELASKVTTVVHKTFYAPNVPVCRP